MANKAQKQAVRPADELDPDLVSLVESTRPVPSETELQRIRKKIARARDLDLEIGDLESRTKILRNEKTELLHKELPALFEGVQIYQLGLESTGNLPAYDATLKDYHKAVLPSKEEPEKRDAALDMLRRLGGEDLSTTEVVIEFQRGEQKKFKTLCSFLKKSKIPYHYDTGVHWGTLTAWVKDRFKNKKPLSPSELETLGAHVGKIVDLKKRKEG